MEVYRLRLPQGRELNNLGENRQMTQPDKAMKPPLTPRQRAVFESLLERFLQNGFVDFTIDRAARELRCSKTTLYALGGTRDDIVERILIGFFRQVAARTEAALRAERSHAATMKAYFDAIVQALEPASPAFTRDLTRDPVGQKVYGRNTEAATDRIRAILEAGVAAGEFRGINVDFVARVTQTTMHRIRRGDFDDILPAKDLYRELGQLTVRGILAHPD